MSTIDTRQDDDPTVAPRLRAAAGDELFTGERLVLAHDPATGLRAAIAVDDTTLGPALGGVRLKAYPDPASGVREAQRLAAAMTLKNAAAGLPYGGGKAVILDDGRATDRGALMAAFGRAVAGLGGTYLPGVDMGTTTDDLAAMGRAGAEVSCADEDPSPWTALGVHAAIVAAVRHLDGLVSGRRPEGPAGTAADDHRADDGGDTAPGDGRAGVDDRRDQDEHPALAGVRVLIQGTGHVGATLARLVRDSGGTVLVADVDPVRASALALETGGTTVPADEALTTECDVLAPCAVARVLDERTIPRLRCRIVAGAANDTLGEHADAVRLADRGVLYVPDFLANAGGVVHIHALRAGWDADRLRAEVEAIGDRVGAVLADASAAGGTPLDAAEALAAERIARARRARDGARGRRPRPEVEPDRTPEVPRAAGPLAGTLA